MIERLLKRALESQLAYFRDNPSRLELFMQKQNDMSLTEAAGVREYFLAHPANVILNYPRQKEPEFPLYAIVLAEERESQPFLGDELGMLHAERADDYGYPELVGSEMLGYVQDHRFHIHVMTEENPDLTLYYYQIAKCGMLRHANALKEAGLLWLRFSGRDLYLDPDYKPANLFVRLLTIECQSLFSVVGDIPNDFFTSVDGIYIQDEPPIAGVTALVNVTNLLDNEEESED